MLLSTHSYPTGSVESHDLGKLFHDLSGSNVATNGMIPSLLVLLAEGLLELPMP